ncbi:hypothetical protein ACQ7B2_31810, partial [Escherichia coli]
LILGGAEVLPLGTASWVAAGLGLLALLGHFLVDFRNPNADLEANQRRAEALEGTGDLWLPEAGRPVAGPRDEVGTGRTGA